MLTGKERRELKKKVHDQEAKVYIGKNGISENLIEEANVLLDKHELIKFKVQKSVVDDKKDIMNQLIEELGAEYVMDIGSVFALYRYNVELH